MAAGGTTFDNESLRATASEAEHYFQGAKHTVEEVTVEFPELSSEPLKLICNPKNKRMTKKESAISSNSSNYIFYGSGLASIIQGKGNNKLPLQYDCFGRLIEYYSTEQMNRLLWSNTRILMEIVNKISGENEMYQWISHPKNEVVLAKSSMTADVFYSTNLDGMTVDFITRSKERAIGETHDYSQMLSEEERIHLAVPVFHYETAIHQTEEQFSWYYEPTVNYLREGSMSDIRWMLTYLTCVHFTEEDSTLQQQDFWEQAGVLAAMYTKMWYVKLKEAATSVQLLENSTQGRNASKSVVLNQPLSGLSVFGIKEVEDLLEINIAQRLLNYFIGGEN